MVVQAVDGAMAAKVKSDWQKELWRETARSGTGRNKLRSYRHFKTHFIAEPYITSVLPRATRSAFAQMRCGVAPIQLELGRYVGQEENDRICPLCGTAVESESHLLVDCSTYIDITRPLLANAETMCPFS